MKSKLCCRLVSLQNLVNKRRHSQSLRRRLLVPHAARGVLRCQAQAFPRQFEPTPSAESAVGAQLLSVSGMESQRSRASRRTAPDTDRPRGPAIKRRCDKRGAHQSPQKVLAKVARPAAPSACRSHQRHNPCEWCAIRRPNSNGCSLPHKHRSGLHACQNAEADKPSMHQRLPRQ